MAISEIITKFREAQNKLILLDYDGTLVNFALRPEGATPTQRLLKILTSLCAKSNLRLIVITGREPRSIDRLLGHLPIDMIAEHGAALKIQGSWKSTDQHHHEWLPEVEKILEEFVSRCRGSFIEKKQSSLTWHYRACSEKEGIKHCRDLISALQPFTKIHQLKIIDGKKVVEVVKDNIDKGRAAKKILDEYNYDFVLAIGDDQTDEDMFRALEAMDCCYTIKVGPGTTYAHYKLVNVPEVLFFLEQL